MAKANKKYARKTPGNAVWRDPVWTVMFGRLVPGPGRPAGKPRLFTVVAEKLPFDCLDDVERQMKDQGLSRTGVYMAHDSMGFVRYVGRGSVFGRLRARKMAQQLELTYFSFFVVEDKNHEREVETLLIRTASPLLFFNERKKRASIDAGNLHDYEPRTLYFERQYKKGRKNGA
jgi:hypothetical protein